MPKSAFRWEGDLKPQRFDQMGLNIKRAMVAAAGKTATEAQGWMRANAKWRDQTGNARNGLGTEVQTSKNNVRVILYHSVPYGIWLEVRWDGKYAIIQPAILHHAPRMMNLIAKLIFKDG